jgi:type II secretory pathway pseudopilin PulG
MLLHNARPDTEQTDAEDGYLLLTVLVMVFLILLALSVAAPKVAKEIQRDKEREAMERGLQYRRAIQLYYKKFGAYPTDIKQLEKTNEIRFLRKRYKDPITGKDDWRLIHMGEAKVPPLGFFGQPLQTGMSSVSTGPGLSGGLYAPTNTDGSGGADGSSTGSTNGLSNGAANGSGNGTAAPATGGSSSFGFSNSGSSNGSSGGLGSSGSGIGSSSGGFGFSNSNSGSSGSGGVGTTPTGTNGPGASGNSGGSTFGSAGPIVGVGIPVKKDSMLEYHKQKKYSDWEFVYDPQTDLIMAGGAANGTDVNGTGANGNGTGLGVNGSNGASGTNGSSGSSGFGFGNGSSGGSSGSSGSSGSGFGNFGSSGSGSGSGTSGNPAPTMPNSPQQ